MIYRGAQVAPFASIDNTQALVALGANLIRYFIYLPQNEAATFTAKQYKAHVRKACDHLDSLFPVVGTKARFVLCLLTPPGGFGEHGAVMFNEKEELQDIVVEIWDEIAIRYRDEPKVLVYDLLNEPSGERAVVNRFYMNCWGAVRTVAPNKIIAISSVRGEPERFEKLPFINDEKIWWETHFYKPVAIVFQGHEGRSAPVPWERTNANRIKIRTLLKPVRDFQISHPGAQMYLGEFAISEFAGWKSRSNWLADVISVAEEYGWHWTVHAWREAPIWNYEKDSRTIKTLSDAWLKNKIESKKK